MARVLPLLALELEQCGLCTGVYIFRLQSETTGKLNWQ